MATEERFQAYVELIEALLACEQGRESGIIQANFEWVDAGLVATMREVAAALLAEGEENNGRWLNHFAEQVESALASLPSSEGSGVGQSLERSGQTSSANEARQQAYLELIQALFQCESGQEPARLEANAELVDAGLVAVMKQYSDRLENSG